jgi:hypothetical protein
MTHRAKRGEQGFISIIILIVVALVALKYFFNFSFFEWIGSGQGKEALLWVKSEVLALWSYIH